MDARNWVLFTEVLVAGTVVEVSAAVAVEAFSSVLASAVPAGARRASVTVLEMMRCLAFIIRKYSLSLMPSRARMSLCLLSELVRTM
jgi:hypothetical protein